MVFWFGWYSTVTPTHSRVWSIREMYHVCTCTLSQGSIIPSRGEAMALVWMSLLLPLRGCCPWISHFTFLSLHFLISFLFPLLLLFTVLKYINKVDHFNHVLMYSCTVNDCLIYKVSGMKYIQIVVLHHHNPFPELLCHPKMKLCPH